MDNLQPIVITHRYTDAVLYSGENKSISEAVVAALNSEADLSKANLSEASLSGANLSWADLSGADLSGASLSGADLSGADLSKANLSKANLSKANLSGANLSWANLSKANLSGASLSEADLSKANLSGADLSKASLSEANLSEADLTAIKKDLLDVLSRARNEASFLLTELEAGRIDGSVYEGNCCCLVGTIAKRKNCRYDALDGVQPDSNRPIERWFLAIRPGDTPENSQIAKITAGWIREFLEATNV